MKQTNEQLAGNQEQASAAIHDACSETETGAKKRKSKTIEENFLVPNFKGVWIPREVCLKKDLTAFEQKLLSTIGTLANSEKAIKTGGCFATNGHLATIMVTSKETVSKTIAKFRKKGYIKNVKSKNKKYPDIRVLEVLNKNYFTRTGGN
ncbi:hypothetical protein ACWPKS_10445 [Coraliomargarita sp. W4R72]